MKTHRTWPIVVVTALLLLGAAVLAMRVPLLQGTRGQVPWEEPRVIRDLDVIATDTLRVLVLRDPLSYEERPGAVSGLEFELLQRFARTQGVPVIALPMEHRDSMLLALQEGRGDIIAAQLVRRSDLRRWVAFTDPYRHVRPMLATLRADPSVKRDPNAAALDVPTDTVQLSPWSPFADPDYRFDKDQSDRLVVHQDQLITPEDLLMEVVIGRHRATVVTDARAMHEAGRFPVLEFGASLGPDQGLRFAVRRNAPRLLRKLNEWLTDPEERDARDQYFKAYISAMTKPGPLRVRKRIPVDGDSISPFDAHFQEHGSGIRWDWELLAAMAWRESRFDSTAISNKGAQGIMQIMPRTGQRFGLDSSSVVDDHIRVAATYLNRLDTLWMRAVPEREQRLRFILASYNAGPGHIIDAQRLAERLGLDPKRWEHNVERAVLLLAKPRYYMMPGMKNGYCKGNQVFHYVRDVLALYQQLRSRPGSASRRSKSSDPETAGL